MLGFNRVHLAGALFALTFAACSHPTASITCPPPGDVCYDNNGNPVYPDGGPITDDGGDAITTDDQGDGDSGSTENDFTDTGISIPTEQDVCFCPTTSDDTDGDCLSAAMEAKLGTDPTKVDTDGDLVRDGCEDYNHNGVHDSTEWNPLNPDSDGDCINDGNEDHDKNGLFTLSTHETSPILLDSDRDGIHDGTEDRNCNGQVDAWVDLNSNGCFDATDTEGETDPALNDTDGDFVGDGKEDANDNGHCDPTENSCAFIADTDCDKLPDGSEDTNRNGIFNTGETNPRLVDSDGDGIEDGIEDANLNGIYEPPAETDPRNIDSDGDTIQDGTEDANHDGIVQGAVFGANGCWNGAAAETDPRKIDSDGDGIHDGVEDKNHNGICDLGNVPDPNAPGGVRTNALVEECAFLVDSDCDGLGDGKEDKNLDGITQQSETDATYNDTDRDGLIDGCPPSLNFTTCEDLNNNGNLDPGETDPRSVDSDFDLLTDRCEVQFSPLNCTSANCLTNPLSEDTDGDGKTDGEEDANHNCVYEPTLGETDPRVANPPPAVGTIAYPKSQVCDAENLKQLTFAAAPDPSLDYQVAFEVEKSSSGTTADYSEQPFGIELSSPDNIILVDDPNDMVWGHIFESPIGVVVDQATGAAVNRNVYGFVYATADTTPLDTTLDDLRDKLLANYGGAVVEVSNVPARPAHDDHPSTISTSNYRVFRAQRQYRINVSNSASGAQSGMQVRQDVLGRIFLPSNELANVRPTTILGDTTDDPVYGAVQCPSNPQCYQNYTMYIGAVQRPQQPTPTAGVSGVTLYVVAITPNDSTANVNDTVTRLYNERLTRLEDLTGGSAVARYEARRSNACEDRNATQARADLLFVVDDSRSMQTLVNKLQQASHDAQAVLTANANNVDFRVAMTTTNPTRFGRTFCASGAANPAPGTFDPTIGCMGYCIDTPSCTTLRNAEAAATLPDGHFNYQLPGGGGTFYFEDTAWMDCKATVSNNVVDACNTVTGFAPFYNNGATNRVRLTGNAGFLGSNPGASCPTYPVNLNFDATDPSTSCDLNPAACCQRLAAECTDGPTVLSSQMCDLIRAMGGRPDLASGAGGARSSSQLEEGVRGSRRLITSMGLAYPLDAPPADGAKNHLRLNCTTTGSLTPCDDNNDCGPFDVCDTTAPQKGKPGTCKPTGNCVACDPRGGTTTLSGFSVIADPTPTVGGHTGHSSCTADTDCGRGERCNAGACIVDCKPVPMVTIFLSDEEDYIFKDDCESSHTTVPTSTLGWQQFAENVTDESQLYTDCYFKDLTNVDANGLPIAEPCINPTDTDPLAYCRNYVTPATGQNYAGFATGYDPDTIPAIGGGLPQPQSVEVMQWRDYNAPECSTFAPPNPATPSNLATPTGTSCLDDPCRIIPDQPTCTNGTNGNYCRWSTSQARCVNYCEIVTADAGGLTHAQQRTNCEANPECYFDTGFGRDGDFNSTVAANNTVTDQLYACQPRIPLNDCQACKRAFRRYGSVIGTTNGVTNLTGLGDVGPVYSIVRERGKPGFRDETAKTQDECAGGYQTWGRGDGQSFRDIAVDTLGRAQDVCAPSYQDFMQLLVTDIVALSAPYKLSQSPIAATIKVGIGRLEPDGVTWDYIEVPRSNSQGFVYDATTNSLGFKSDPIDGVCPGFTCSADGVITDGEIQAARAITDVPRANDLVFISYRFWRPVPCVEGCPVGETCVRSLCPPPITNPASCTPATVTADCPVGASCDATNHCIYDCTDDGYLERCVPNPCGQCQSYDSTTGTCITPTGANAQCQCFDMQATAINCNPLGPDTCPPGLYCDESCVCLVSSICSGGFNPDGTVKDCTQALNCCARFAACENSTTAGTCTDAACQWDGSKCTSKFSECCQPGEVAVCYQPVEDPSRSVFGCQGGSCSCTTTQACSTDNDCAGNVDSFGNGASKCLNGHCDCNPVTQSCLTDSGGSCACKQTPG